MKIAIRRGHNRQATGSVGIVNEVIENENILAPTIKYLKQLGHEVLDVSPGNMNSDNDLAYGVRKANEWGADLFFSIHNNKAYSSYNGAIGTEAYVYSKSDNFKDEEIAQRVVNKICSLGFKNRGVKEGTYYELKNTKMNAFILECFFVEATEDVALYKRLGADAIGKAIAEGVANKTITTTPPTQAKTIYRVVADGKQIGAYSDLQNVTSNVSTAISKGAKNISIERV